MALDVFFASDVRKQIVGDLVLAISMVLIAGGEVARLAGAVGVYRSQAARYGLDWPGIVNEVQRTLPAEMNTRVFDVPATSLNRGENND